jgi:hypothetical protein
MSTTILSFPGFLLDNDGKGFWKGGKYFAGVDALMESLTEPERCRLLDWNRRRYPQAVCSRSRNGGGSAA